MAGQAGARGGAMKGMGIGAVFQWLVVAIVLVGIWKIAGGNPQNIVNGLWRIVDVGSGIVQQLWRAVARI